MCAGIASGRQGFYSDKYYFYTRIWVADLAFIFWLTKTQAAAEIVLPLAIYGSAYLNRKINLAK